MAIALQQLHLQSSQPGDEMASLHWEPTGDVEVWRRTAQNIEKDTTSLQNALSAQAGKADPRVIFIKAKKNEQPKNASGTADLSSAFDIPKWLWFTKKQDSNGYFYGRSQASGNQGAPTKHVTVFRFMIKYVTRTEPNKSGPIPHIFYDWHILTFVTYWESGGIARLLCFNSPDSLKSLIEQSLRDASFDDLKAHPFAFHGFLLEHVAELYDRAIWQFRDFVRATEEQRLTIEEPQADYTAKRSRETAKQRLKLQAPQADYTAMHELARHVMHSSEVISTALNVMDHILAELLHATKNINLTTNYDPGPSIRHQKSMLQFMRNRSQALEDRLKNEINLAFHITAQYSNRISADIARAAQVDSRSMKTISILGLVFLPGTFISAIFSMSFFNFEQATPTQPASWAVSEKFWLYWVVAIPVTALTVGCWWTWQIHGERTTLETDSVGKEKEVEESV